MNFWKNIVKGFLSNNIPTDEARKRAFEEVAAMINRKRVEDVQYEQVITRSIAILETDPGNKDVQELAGLSVYGFVCINRCALEHPLLRHPLVAAEFAQCSICAMLWVPHPGYKPAAELEVTNAVGGWCKHCNLVFCRNCYKGGFACPQCGSTLNYVVSPNGWTRSAPGCFR